MPSTQSQPLIDHYQLSQEKAGISRIVVFGDPELVGRFGLPPVHPG